MSKNLDNVDIRIMDALQRDADLPIAELGKKAGLSATPCWRRVKMLEERGVLGKKVRLLNRRALGLKFVAFINVSLSTNGRQSLGQFERAVLKMPEVVECHLVTGTMDYVMKVVTVDIEAYQEFVRTVLTPLPFIREVHSYVGLTEVKAETLLPLNLLNNA
jgi:Lrp/AsnC family transcriptional regulator